MISLEVEKLHKKLKRIERQYSRLPQKAKVQKMRLAKSYSATIEKIEKLTGRKMMP
jgi:archaellum component FlaC